MKRYEVELFKDLSDEINQYAKLIKFKKSDVLFYGDELMNYFYMVTKGRIKSYQLNLNNSKEQTIFIFSIGDMFDVITLLDKEPHDVMYEALEDSELMQFPIEKVREWLINNRSFNEKFFPYLASQMRHIEELATDLSLHNTQERLIKLILQNLDPNSSHRYNLIQNLSNSEIAKLIGTVRHVVERHLTLLKKEGAINEGSRKNLSIKNIDKLLAKF